MRIQPDERSVGTCIVYKGEPNLVIITAHHVVNGIRRGSKLLLTSHNGIMNATVVRTDHVGDLAVINVDQIYTGLADYPCHFGNEDMIYGQDVFLMGFPVGEAMENIIGDGKYRYRGTTPYLRKGIISNMKRDEFIVDSFLQKGFSGGPVVDCGNPRMPKIFGIVASGRQFTDDILQMDDNNGATIRSGFVNCIDFSNLNIILRSIGAN
jgi:S1-C subfamily serine protease